MARPKGHPLNPDAFEDLAKLKGKTLTMVAEAAGMNRATLSGLLGGHHSASLPVAHKIAAALGVKVGTLFPDLADKSVRSTEAA